MSMILVLLSILGSVPADVKSASEAAPKANFFCAGVSALWIPMAGWAIICGGECPAPTWTDPCKPQVSIGYPGGGTRLICGCAATNGGPPGASLLLCQMTLVTTEEGEFIECYAIDDLCGNAPGCRSSISYSPSYDEATCCP